MNISSRLELDNKIQELLGLEVMPSIINNQITKFMRELKCSYLDIARAVAYYFIVLERPYEQKYGIGIIPSVLEDSRKYFYLEGQRIKAQQKDIADFNHSKKVIVLCKNSLKRENRIKTIDISKIKGEEKK